ncbi:MAG: hypothetical protein HZB19_06470 [Chloroflexi bacterium]|nr:hypothetical protein [Chloroflexota bacterium]
MFLLAMLAFLPKLILGFSIAHLIWPDGRISSLLLKFFLGIPLGMGIASILFFFSKLWSLDRWSYIAVELTFVAAAFTAMLLARKDTFRRIEFDVDSSIIKQNKFLILLVILAAAISLMGFFSTTLLRPHGREDAWSNWNLVARFVYYSDDLTNALDYIAISSFPGYPFMLGLDVANGWTFVNTVTTRVPILAAGLFAFSIPGILFFGLFKTRGIQSASIAAILVLGPWLAQFAAGLYSDVPMAAFYLGAGVLISLYLQTGTPGLAALAGLIAGLPSWAKNDGIPFAIITAIIMFLVSFKRRDAAAIVRFVLGLALPLAVVAIYHEFLASPGNVVANGSEMLLRLQDPSRLRTVLEFFIRETSWFGSPASGYVLILLAILVVGGIDLGNENSRIIPFVFLSQYAVYFAVYLVTPLPLEWHLGSSLQRVLVHLIPLLTFTVFSLLRKHDFSLFQPVGNRHAPHD